MTEDTHSILATAHAANGARRTCYVHIGPYKTGSSSIKHFIWANEDAIERQGLYVPKIIGENGARARNHGELLKWMEVNKEGDLRPNAHRWPEVETVANAGEQNILLSSEMFVDLIGEGPGVFSRMLTFFEKRNYRVVIIAYVRDQPALLNSWYVQSQKRMSFLKTFDEFVERQVEAGRVEPARYLAPFLGNNRCELEVVSFERAAKEGLVVDFLRRCGVDASGFEPAVVRNTNAGAKTVYVAQEVMRRTGQVEGLRMVPGYPKVYNHFQKKTRKRGWDETPYIALDQPTYEAIRERFAASNDAFAQEHFGVSWSELCPPRTYERSMFDPETAQPKDMMRVEKTIAKLQSKFSALIEKFGGQKGNRRERNAALAE